jgi:Cu2+-containing amine oxidase
MRDFHCSFFRSLSCRSGRPCEISIEPVTEQGFSDAVAIVKNAGYLSDSAVFALLSLEEPAKSAVQQWKPGMAVDREIKAIVYDRKARKTTEAVVSLTSGKL